MCLSLTHLSISEDLSSAVVCTEFVVKYVAIATRQSSHSALNLSHCTPTLTYLQTLHMKFYLFQLQNCYNFKFIINSLLNALAPNDARRRHN